MKMLISFLSFSNYIVSFFCKKNPISAYLFSKSLSVSRRCLTIIEGSPLLKTKSSLISSSAILNIAPQIALLLKSNVLSIRIINPGTPAIVAKRMFLPVGIPEAIVIEDAKLAIIDSHRKICANLKSITSNFLRCLIFFVSSSSSSLFDWFAISVIIEDLKIKFLYCCRPKIIAANGYGLAMRRYLKIVRNRS